jgi:hypothetical protein
MNTSDTIRNIRNKLLEATSSYEDRVLQVAQKVMKREDLTSSQLDEEIEYASKELEITEYKIKKRAWKVFVKDVKAKMRDLGWKAKRKTSERNPREAVDYDKIVQEIIFEIGDIFPDGDPHDACLNWCRKHYYSEDRFFHELWPKAKKAFKKATGFDDLYDYYQDLIKQHEADNEGPVYSDID